MFHRSSAISTVLLLTMCILNPVVAVDLGSVHDTDGWAGPQGRNEGLVARAISVMGLPITENMGQVRHEEVLFHTKDTYFTGTGIIKRVLSCPDKERDPADISIEPGIVCDMHVFEMVVKGANAVLPVGEEPYGHRSNYFIGNDPRGWATDVPNYASLRYRGIYDEIDLVFRNTPQGLKYEFTVMPGGDVEDIALEFKGVDLSVSPTGTDLFIGTSAGTVVDGGLVAFQDPSTGRDVVPAAFMVDGDEVGFMVDYDRDRPLVIDPLIYSTYIGGSAVSGDFANDLEVDANNNVYITGSTASTDFPTTSAAYDDTPALEDAFVLKMDPDGSDLTFSTFLGGSGLDYGMAITYDNMSMPYVTGYTYSPDFPVNPGAFQDVNNGSADIFIVKMTSWANSMLFGTYIGGSGKDVARAIALDSSKKIYLTGETESPDLPTTPGAFNTTYGGNTDSFVIKMEQSHVLDFSTYLSGNRFDSGYDIAIDGSRNVYVAGRTNSTDFKTTAGAYRTVLTDAIMDGFALKLNSSGDKLLFSTFIGGSSQDEVHSLALDASDNMHMTGLTRSPDFPVTPGAYNDTYGGQGDAFLLKLNSAGTNLVYSTFFGGTGYDYGEAVVLHDGDLPFLLGMSKSSTLPVTKGAFDSSYGGGDQYGDLFLARFDVTASNVSYCTYIGGSSDDRPAGLGLNALGEAFMVGTTSSANYPITANSHSTAHSGGVWDVFATRFNLSVPPGIPLNLTTNAGDRFIELDWEPPEDDGGMAIEEYIVLRGSDKFNLKTLTSSVSSYFKDNDLLNGRVYYYAVQASNKAGAGDSTETVSDIPGTWPTEPVNLEAKRGDGFVNLTWYKPLDIKGFAITNYTIYRGPSSSNLSKLVVLGLEQAYNDWGLTNGVRYYYAVSASNLKGEGKRSAIVEAIPARPPSPPINLTAETGNGYVLLKWDPPLDIGGASIINYTIFRERGISEVSFNLSSPKTLFNDTDIKNGMTYRYSVAARNIMGLGNRTEPVSIDAGGPPSRPYMIALSGPGCIRLYFEILDSGGFPIEVMHITRGLNETNLTYLGNTTQMEYEDTDIEYERNYYYQVWAENVKGLSPLSLIVNTTPNLRVPGPPVNATIKTDFKIVSLDWDPPENEGGVPIIWYDVYRGYDKGELRLYARTDAPGFTDERVLNGYLYFYAVSAVNSVGEGQSTETLNGTPCGAPSSVRNFAAEPSHGEVLLEWDPPDDNGGFNVQGYSIYRGASEEDMAFLFLTMDEWYTDPDVDNGRLYVYMVRAVNKLGEGPRSEASPVTPGGPPSPPSALKVTMQGDHVRLKWALPEDEGGFSVTHYMVYRTYDKFELEPLGTTMNLTFVDKRVKDGKKVFYLVSAVNIRGEGEPTEAKKIEIPEKIDVEVLIAAASAVVVLMVGAVVAKFLYDRLGRRDTK